MARFPLVPPPLLVLLPPLLCAACPVALTDPADLDFACRGAADCAEGYSCVASRCVEGSAASGQDAAAPDAEQADAAVADARQPDTARPDGADPDTSAPDIRAPDAASLDAGLADTGTSDASQPDRLALDGGQADAAQLDAMQLDAVRSDTLAADAAQSDAWQPDTWQPDTWQPDTWQPDTWQPDAWQPDTWQPDTALAVTCELQSGDWSFSDPEPVSELNTEDIERDPVLSADGLTVYFTSSRPGSEGWDIYRATRTSRQDAFGAPAPVPELNSAQNDSRVSFTADELIVVVASTRDNGAGGSDFWSATRLSRQDAFGPLTLVPVLSTADNEYDPTVSPDGLRIYYAPTSPPDQVGGQDVVMAERASRQEDFSPPVNLTSVNSSSGDADPTFTFDELILLFASSRPDGLGGSDIWYATRSSIDQDFSAPQHLPVVNSDASEGDPFLSGDGCELFFSSNRGDGAGDRDIWVARYQSGG